MRYFFSVGEPSGDIHGANLIRQLRRLDPGARFVGFGGDRMAQAGCELSYPLADLSVMGLIPVIAELPKFVGLLRQAKAELNEQRPDAVILIDYPGFNWHIARASKRLGIPVFYYVPPQLWAWASWRVSRVRRWVDRVLCSLPFEESWYHKRNVPQASYVGHPFFDDLAERRLDQAFIDEQRSRDNRRVIALLPGSRRQEVRANYPQMVESARRIVGSYPNARFLVAGHKEQHRPIFEAISTEALPIELLFGRTPEIIALADAAIACSGSVSLELLYHRVPTAIVYHTSRVMRHFTMPLLMRCPYFTLVNLMAGKILYPEFVDCVDRSADVAAAVLDWLENELERQRLIASLDDLHDRYCQPGAARRAADQIVGTLTLPSRLRQSA